MNFRKLSDAEINILRNQNCSADNWNEINVANNFDLTKVKNSNFSGTIHMENFEKEIKNKTGISKTSGIYDSYIHNCYIGSNSLINNVKLLANYHIGQNVIIENVNNLTVSEKTAFGNGTSLEILNEGGGRELKIFDKLSAQLAYLIVTRRDMKRFINNVDKLIDKYTESVSSVKGFIGNESHIINCNYINNVKFGSFSNVHGAMHLEEGTIASNPDAPVIIGEGVIAKSFIILSGTKIDGMAILDKAFVGQGTKIGKQYSAENSAFFANCEGFHGEACSIFAGPYSVTHHKSTLLIAGMFSFYNAGSGSNQSNHLYKLGPVHQGVLERGAKTGSFSYMMWPCKIGAFTGIIGKHYANFDTSKFPFSYILESNGKSLLMPAMNLCTVGTKRDSAKWPKRDRRKDIKKYDRINFELFSPFVVGKILDGIKELENISSKSLDDTLVELNGIFIKKSKIKDALQKYRMIIDLFIGDEIIKKIKEIVGNVSIDKILNNFASKNSALELEKWIDVSGMFSPEHLIENLINSVQKSDINSIDNIEIELDNIFKSHNKNLFNWCLGLMEKIYKKKINKFSMEDIIKIISDWKTAKITFNNLVLKDAEKEFQNKIKIGFGLDGNSLRTDKDFKEVRGTYNENNFVKEIQDENEVINKISADLINKIKNAN